VPVAFPLSSPQEAQVRGSWAGKGPDASLSEEVSLNFRHGMLGKVLADFSNDPLPDIGVERAPQVGKRVSIGSRLSKWNSSTFMTKFLFQNP
jgi:hypothetical protein